MLILAWWFSISVLWEKKYALNLSLVGPLLDMHVHGIYMCLYVHMHMCATMVIFIMINPAILLWSCTYYFLSHLINMLNPIYIFVRSITWVTWQLYFPGVDIFMYTLLHGKRIWMPKRRWWCHFQHTTHFRILYIFIVDFIEPFYFILLRHFNFAKYWIQHIYTYIGKHGKDNCDVTKYSMIWRHTI